MRARSLAGAHQRVDTQQMSFALQRAGAGAPVVLLELLQGGSRVTCRQRTPSGVDVGYFASQTRAFGQHAR